MNERQRPQLIAGIHWVRGEIEQSIARARGLIDHYAESGGDALQLQQAYTELDQVRAHVAIHLFQARGYDDRYSNPLGRTYQLAAKYQF